jgi:hypothetical protein
MPSMLYYCSFIFLLMFMIIIGSLLWCIHLKKNAKF